MGPDFDAYFAKHGYPYGAQFGQHNTPSLPYPEYETRDVPYGSYHRSCSPLGYSGSNTYGPYGPHHGAVVGPDDFSRFVGGFVHYPGTVAGTVGPTPFMHSRGPHGHLHAAYG